MPLNPQCRPARVGGIRAEPAEDGSGGRHHQVSGRGAHRAVRPCRCAGRIRDGDHSPRHPHRAVRRYARRRSRAAQPSANSQRRAPPDETPLSGPASMARTRRRQTQAAPAAFLALVLLAGCSSLGDFGRLHPVLVTDDIHAWSGRSGGAGWRADVALPLDREGANTARPGLSADRTALRALRGLSLCA